MVHGVVGPRFILIARFQGQSATNNDLNVVARSPLMRGILEGLYNLKHRNGFHIESIVKLWNLLYFIVDGIYIQTGRYLRIRCIKHQIMFKESTSKHKNPYSKLWHECFAFFSRDLKYSEVNCGIWILRTFSSYQIRV